MRVLYVQYTNPGLYPPLIRGAQRLAEAGADVSMLGVRVPGLDALGVPPTAGVTVRLLPPASDGWRLKAHYARYAAWVAREAAAWKPDWIYASDLFAAPIALALRALTGARLLYHEHDAPSLEHESWAVRRCLTARTRIAREAAIVVVPNAERAAALSQAVAGGRPVLTVWNCPRRPAPDPAADFGPTRESGQGLRVIFRGSINADRLPATVIHALARVEDPVTLAIASYETAGSRGYVAHLQALAAELGIAHRVNALGTVPELRLGAICARSDVGLALMPPVSRDENMRHMTGASNKVFEYLSYGVAPLVTDLPDWRAAFVDGGYALACDPADVESIAGVLAWAAAHRPTLRAIASRGYARLMTDWNYESQFEPVMRLMGEGAPVAVSAPGVAGSRCAS
jgi:glycosyltransferase involved in cell wall biosynthesis